MDRDWILRFCKALQDRNLDITWLLPTGTRAEAIDETVAQALKDTGMVSMAYAPESGSETTRKLVKKRMHTQALFDSIQAALAQDLNVALFMVIGFPHDTPQHLDETMAFLEDVARIGAEDVAIAYYMAMPGTQLFGSLYDSGQIRMDRTYFNHLFANSDLIPVSSYAPHLSRWQLFWAKCRFYLKFYCFSPHAKRSRSGLAFLQAIGSFFSRNGHQSRMQSALTAGVRSGWHTLVVQFTPMDSPCRRRCLVCRLGSPLPRHPAKSPTTTASPALPSRYHPAAQTSGSAHAGPRACRPGQADGFKPPLVARAHIGKQGVTIPLHIGLNRPAEVP
ncbi:MAG: hypothetical protein R2857_09410 [Vampirovibrionales bacterium]